jgi:CubicO group peptidase (beta-lactamase class C family)
MKAMINHQLTNSLKALLLLAVSTSALIAQGQSPIEGLDRHIEAVQREFEVPGLSVAIVKDGKIVLTQGYGIVKMGKPTQVNEKTLFPIASNTKGVTATALGILVDRGELQWDQPVIDHLPAFQLSNPYVTREFTVRDLLVHRSGLSLGAGDLLFWPPTSLTRKEIVQKLRYVPLTSSFRSRYAYDNVLYPVAGELIEAVSGMTWEDFLIRNIFQKVGMNRTRPIAKQANILRNRATPHARVNGKIQIVQPFDIDNVAPAGGIHSSAEEMAKWIKVLLNQGQLDDGTQLISRETVRELWTLVTPIPIGTQPPSLAAMQSNFLGYALGFAVRDYRGHKMVSHTGGLPGFLSQVTMLPKQKLGIVVLTNQESGYAFRSITHWILDHYLNISDTDWLAAFKESERNAQIRLKQTEEKIETSRDESSRPSLPLKEYADTYIDPWYGNIQISLTKQDRLQLEFSHTEMLKGELEHWQHDTFIVHWHLRELRADAYITFALNPEGTINHAKMKAVSPATDFSYDFHDLHLKPTRRNR